MAHKSARTQARPPRAGQVKHRPAHESRELARGDAGGRAWAHPGLAWGISLRWEVDLVGIRSPETPRESQTEPQQAKSANLSRLATGPGQVDSVRLVILVVT